jgi:hypothetical protein
MPEAPNPNKPTPVDETFVVDPFVLSESQDFPLEFVVSGKSKDCMSSEHFGQLAWQFKRASGSSGLKVQAAIAC